MTRAIASLSILALAGTAMAQPASTPLGAINADRTENGTVGAAAVLWYSFSLPSDASAAALRYFDIDTNGSVLNDTMLGLYSDMGGLIAFNDDGGIGLKSLLSFGSGGGTALTDGGNGSTGASGNLAAGSYFLAVTQFPTTFGPTDWTVTPPGAGAGGDVVVNFTTGTIPPPPPSWNEETDGGGDAGQDTATAQVPSGSGELPAITGAFGANDVDIYRINICDSGSFSATTVAVTTVDTQLFLFNSDGVGVTYNDDSGAVLQSTITNQFIPSNGDYYLAISRYNIDPADADGNLLWANTPFGVERQPDEAGAANPFAQWIGINTATANYRINLTGACYSGPAGCGPADIGGAGGAPGADGVLDNNDFIVYIDNFFNQAPSADIGAAGGVAGSDGLYDNNDFIVFIDQFFNGTC